jgi:hypothetical protein
MRTSTSFLVLLAGLVALGFSRLKAAEVFWSEPDDFRIRAASLDGSNIVDVLSGLPAAPHGIAIDASASKLYWVSPFGGYVIQRADLNGSNVENLAPAGNGEPGEFRSPRSIALDLTGAASGGVAKMYVGETQSDFVRRANLDGSDVEPLPAIHLDDSDVHCLALDAARSRAYLANVNGEGSASHGLFMVGTDGAGTTELADSYPLCVAVDEVDEKLYWIDGRDGEYGSGTEILWANHDGTNPRVFLTGVNAYAGSLAVDVHRRQLYWGDVNGLTRINLDGSGQEVVVPEAGVIFGVAIRPVPEPSSIVFLLSSALVFLLPHPCKSRRACAHHGEK